MGFEIFLGELYDDQDPAAQENAIVQLVELVSLHVNKWEIPEFPDVLSGIVRLLFKDERPSSQTQAAWALANLSYAHVPDNKEKTAGFPQVLSGLVRLLSCNESSAQDEAVRALRNLACAQENGHIISLFPEAIPALLKLLFDDSKPGLQVQATMAMLNLIGNAMAAREVIEGPEGEGKDSSEFPDVLQCLIQLWFPNACSSLQKEATSSIIELVERTLENPDLDTEAGNMHGIADFPDNLVRLIGALTLQDESHQKQLLQDEAKASKQRSM